MLCKIQISEAYFENFSVPVWKKKKELAKCFIFRLKLEACMRSDIPFNLRCIPSALLFLCIGSFSMFADICPSCKQSYPDFTRLAVHCALEHGTWLCPKCPQTFHVKDRKLYWHHRIKEHLEAVCFACNLRAFRDPREWERHRKQHGKDNSLLSLNNVSCCPQAPVHFGSHWVRKLHTAHFHGSWLDFFATVRVLSDCCESFRGAILTDYSDYLKDDLEDDVREKFLKGIRNFSKHVYHKHGLCFLCERELTPEIDKDIFDNQPHISADVFLPSGIQVLVLSKEQNLPCFCGQKAQHNVESRLFALKIDRLPFGTGLDTVTHPFYCIIDGSGDKSGKNLSDDLKIANEIASECDEKSVRNHSDEPIKDNTEVQQSPSFSTKSVDTTLTSTDNKKQKKVPEVDAHTVLLTGNETGKASENL